MKAAISIPVIANGDIKNATQAQQVLDQTGADAIMIGRAAQGQPWIFQSILSELNNEIVKPLTLNEIQTIMNQHLEALYRFYGELAGLRIARKHIGWYFEHLNLISTAEKKVIYQLNTANEQLTEVNRLLSRF